MRTTLLALGGLAFGALFTICGALLAIRPDKFLRFHDFLNPGDRWNKQAEWRKDVNNLDYKALGILFAIVGLFMVIAMLTKLL